MGRQRTVYTLYHRTAHSISIRSSLSNIKGIRLYSDVTVRNKVEEESDPYTPCTLTLPTIIREHGWEALHVGKGDEW
jgi:hypothetical protein